jgi:hypothetical protein
MPLAQVITMNTPVIIFFIFDSSVYIYCLGFLSLIHFYDGKAEILHGRFI